MNRYTFPSLAVLFALLFLFGVVALIPMRAQAIPPTAQIEFGTEPFFKAVKEGADLGKTGLLLAAILTLGVVVVNLDKRRERERAKEHAELLSHHNNFVAIMTGERAAIQVERLSMQTTLIRITTENVTQLSKTDETMRHLSTELHDFREALNSLTVAIGQLRKP